MIAYTPTNAELIVGMICLIILACLLAHLKKDAPSGRNEQLMRRHRRIRERQLGEANRDDGFICHPVMFFITGILGAHAALAIGYAITCAVFGFQEPSW